MDPVLKFSISNQIIIRTDSFRIVAGSRNYLRAEFVFLTPEWDSINKTAIFEFENEKRTAILQNNSCEVPWEWLENAGLKSVSIFGGDLITSNKAMVMVYESGYGEGEVTKPPTPSAYEQVLVKLDEKADEIIINGEVIKLLSGEKVISEAKINIDGGNFSDWR